MKKGIFIFIRKTILLRKIIAIMKDKNENHLHNIIMVILLLFSNKKG